MPRRVRSCASSWKRSEVAHDVEPQPAALTARIEARLRSAGVRVSEPRRAVIEALISSPDHVSSEELALRLRGRGERVSLSTVYRCLRKLVGVGVAREIRVGDTSRFELEVGRDRHDHLVCVTCGAILEFTQDRLGSLAGEICREHGWAASPRIELRTKCGTCARASSVDTV
jgi:Fe2+ or Zn2+ uptake regulation protein